MNILKRTMGIDTKAKSGAIRGEVVFQLRDAITGKITEEQKGHNMLTNGLDSALNKCPFGLDKLGAMYGDVNTAKYDISPIFRQLLGGVILFPTALGSDADLLFPDFDNSPVAFASCAEYTQSDNRQGTYDKVSSGLITGGFKHVFSWGSAYGNGQIASLGLAPMNAHTWCYDSSNMLKPWALETASSGYYKTFDGQGETSTKILAVCPTGTLVKNNSGDLAFYGITPYALNLFERLGSNNSLVKDVPFEYDKDDLTKLDGYKWKYTLGANMADFSAQIIGQYVYLITRSSDTFTIRKISIADGTLSSTETHQYTGKSFGSGKSVIYNGYLYNVASTGDLIYKCDLSSTTAVDVTATGVTANRHLFSTGTQWIYGQDFILDGESDKVVVAGANIFDLGQGTANRFSNYPVYENGAWLVCHGTSSGIYTYPQLQATIKQWALMTHFDLQTSVEKNANKQMLVQYSITQV